MSGRWPLAELTRELGGQATSGLEGLADPDLEKLLLAVREAKRQQKDALRKAIDDGMSFVPALLRGALRRILFS